MGAPAVGVNGHVCLGVWGRWEGVISGATPWGFQALALGFLGIQDGEQTGDKHLGTSLRDSEPRPPAGAQVQRLFVLQPGGPGEGQTPWGSGGLFHSPQLIGWVW